VGLIVLGLGVAPGAQGEIQGNAAPVPGWDLEIGGGFLLYEPVVENIPGGSAERVVDPLVEVSLACRLSSRLLLRVSGSYAEGATIKWTSDSGGGSADIPTPSVSTAFVSVEAPLHIGRLTPFAALGGGLTHFAEVDEMIRFQWPSYSEDLQLRFPAHTDGTVLFDLGLGARLGGGLGAVIRYRLLSVFSADQVNTIDRITLAARFDF
jgi:hypothetical protein